MHVEVQESGRQMEPRYVPDATAMLKELEMLGTHALLLQ